MENPHTVDRERGLRDATCARCGGAAEWIYADREQTRVEVICPDCGRFEMPRAAFNRAESEIVDPEEP